MIAYSFWTFDRASARSFADAWCQLHGRPPIPEGQPPFNHSTGPYEFHSGNPGPGLIPALEAFAKQYGLTVDVLRPERSTIIDMIEVTKDHWEVPASADILLHDDLLTVPTTFPPEQPEKTVPVRHKSSLP